MDGLEFVIVFIFFVPFLIRKEEGQDSYPTWNKNKN